MILQAKHLERTKQRATVFQELFGTKPAAVFPHHQMSGEGADGPIVDVFVYPLSMEGSEDFIVAVTNGLTDEQSPENPSFELLQYLPTCTPGHALRLLELSRLPKAGIPLAPGQLLTGMRPIVPGTAWTNALFLLPPIEEHQSVGGISLLWYLPLTDRECRFAQLEGMQALLEKMDSQNMPIIFDEDTRQELV